MCLCWTSDHFKNNNYNKNNNNNNNNEKNKTCFGIVKIMWHVTTVSIYSNFRHFLSSTHWLTQGPGGGCVDTVVVGGGEEEEQQCGHHQRWQGLNSKTQPKLPVWSSHKCGSSTPQRLEFIPLCIISSGWWATRWIKLIHIHWGGGNTELWQVLQVLRDNQAVQPEVSADVIACGDHVVQVLSPWRPDRHGSPSSL